MRILITNDDGINAPGLKVMRAIAADIAGPTGEVWTVAPAFEQSGVGHCISYTHPFLTTAFGPREVAIEGSPADCVLTALHDVMATTPPDLVLSGVNRGNNSAENTLYSGTIGAAMEAALQGHTAIALSQYYGPVNRDLDDPFEAAVQHGAEVVRRILKHNDDISDSYKRFFNVNFPPVAGPDVKGIRLGPQGFRAGKGFHVQAQTAPSGRQFMFIAGGDQQRETAAGSDAALNLDGYISVTPMRADLTDHAALTGMQGINT